MKIKPIYLENHWLPKFLSKYSPVTVWAITIWPFIFCQGTLDKVTKNHETIHFEQYLDLWVIGFPFVYYYDYIVGILRYKNNLLSPYGDDQYYANVYVKSYFRIRAEQEAYANANNLNYLAERRRFKWLNNRV